MQLVRLHLTNQNLINNNCVMHVKIKICRIYKIFKYINIVLATCFRVGKSYKESKECFLKASENYLKHGSYPLFSYCTSLSKKKFLEKLSKLNFS